MKPHINRNYTISNNDMHKYRALAITKPNRNMSGTYSCDISSYSSYDKKSANLQVIVPESELKVDLTKNKENEQFYDVHCTAKAVFPEPKLSISLVLAKLFISIIFCPNRFNQLRDNQG